MKKSDFSVIIITWNRLNDLKSAVKSVLKQKNVLFEIIIVDNNSNDGTEDWVKSSLKNKAKYIKLHKNCGVVTARNIGIANSSGNIIFLFDDDAEINDVFLFYKVKNIFKNINPGIVSVNILENDKYREKEKERYYSGCFSAGSSFIKKEIFDKIGYFDDNYFRQSEELDFSFRMFEKGYNIYCCPDLFIIHKLNQNRQPDEEILYYSFRNKSLTIEKNIKGIDSIFFDIRNNFIYFFIFLKIKKLNLYFKALHSKKRIMNEKAIYKKSISQNALQNWYYLMKNKPSDITLLNNKMNLIQYIFYKIKND